jgi:hypothetical protein
MTRKYMDFETSEYYLFTSPAFSLQYDRQFPSSPVEGGSAVVVPTQKAPPFDEKSLSIESTPWALNMPQCLGGGGVVMSVSSERCCLRKAAGHQRIQSRFERRQVPPLRQNGFALVRGPLLKGERRVYAYIHLNQLIFSRVSLLRSSRTGARGDYTLTCTRC